MDKPESSCAILSKPNLYDIERVVKEAYHKIDPCLDNVNFFQVIDTRWGDFIIPRPTWVLDGKTIMKDAKLRA